MYKSKVQMYVEHKGINEGRVVLHSDLNNFFASVECKKRPELTLFPVAVCGSVKDRHGIVLAKNEKAKKYGVKTGDAIWQAKLCCPDLIVVEPNYDDYMYYSGMVRGIYCQYSERVEPFGLDEAWIDLTGSRHIKTLSDGYDAANEIRNRVFEETGLTVSIGVSDNKVFSKLASDYKKPDAVTLFGPDNYLDTVAKMDVGELLFVGRSSKATLSDYGIRTIGQAAKAQESFMGSVLGKNGKRIHLDASGFDCSVVSRTGEVGEIKSIGNSTTPCHDLNGIDEVSAVFHSLSEKVAWRLRSACLMCSKVSISVRDTSLLTTEHQCAVVPTDNALDIAKAAIRLFCDKYDVSVPVRSVGVRTSKLSGVNSAFQISLFDTETQKREKRRKLDEAVDGIRKKYGIGAVKRAVMCSEQMLDYRDFAFFRERHSVANARNF